MCTGERELCRAVVEVGNCRPGTDVVAGFAADSRRCAEVVRIAVTCRARRVAEQIMVRARCGVLRVAIRTCDRRMGARQRKSRFAMTNEREGGWRESIGRMTRLAPVSVFRRELSGMRVFVT